MLEAATSPRPNMPGLPLLTTERAIELARQIVTEVGDEYKYEAPGDICMYVDKGKPDCIVAHILHRHGMTVEQIADWEGIPAFNLAGIGRGGMGPRVRSGPNKDKRLPIIATKDAGAFLDTLQNLQDNGETWAASLDGAIESIRHENGGTPA